MIIMANTSGWEQGGTLDTARPSVRLVAVADRATGTDRRCGGLEDDELASLFGRWAACESWATAAKLAVLVELVRRRGVPGSEGPSGVPVAWDDSLTEEIMMAVGMSRQAAAKLIDVAVALATRLDATAAALAGGEVDYLKCKIIADATMVLEDLAASNAEKLALKWAGGSFKEKTPGEIGRLIDRAVVVVDPDGAELRRKAAEKSARVETYRESTGTMAMAAMGLNPQVALEAQQVLQDTAEAYKAAGVEGGMDQLRAQVLTDKIRGVSPLTGTGEGEGMRAAVHLTLPLVHLPLLTVLGAADNPGEADGWGVLDPALVREFAQAAARAGNQSEWHLSITDEQGRAIGHGCSLTRRAPKPDTTDSSWDGARVALTMPGGKVKNFTLAPVPVFGCDHRYESSGHDPSRLLRHLTDIRDGGCVQIGCPRRAAKCDFEHNIPFEKGGRTCGCNCGPKCRRDHQIKQSRTWRVEMIAPGFYEWHTPSGRSYLRGPKQYPI
jgi:hypothetical protein